jgi:pimeloyl-ACP methyl ester carboxylesterase
MIGPRELALKSLSAHGFHRVVYREWGDADNARVVVCVHGLTRNGRDFDVLAARIADRFRVLCPDMPGRGDSEWLRDPNDYAFPTYLTTLTALLAHAHADRVAWVGTSMGGLLGMVMAAQAETPVTRLVVNDVGPFIEPVALARIAAYVGLDPMFESYAALEAHVRSVSAPFGPLTDALPLFREGAVVPFLVAALLGIAAAAAVLAAVWPRGWRRAPADGR